MCFRACTAHGLSSICQVPNRRVDGVLCTKMTWNNYSGKVSTYFDEPYLRYKLARGIVLGKSGNKWGNGEGDPQVTLTLQGCRDLIRCARVADLVADLWSLKPSSLAHLSEGGLYGKIAGK